MALVQRVGEHTATVVLDAEDLVRLLGLLDYAIPEGAGGKYTKLVRGFDALKDIRSAFAAAQVGMRRYAEAMAGDSLFTGARGLTYWRSTEVQ